MRTGVLSVVLLSTIFVSALVACPRAASAETIAAALASAYADNPEINAARAGTRAADENVPLAKSGLYPVVSGFGESSGTSKETAFSSFESVNYLAALGLQIQQPLFRGFRVVNAIREAKSDVLAQRELLRNTAQNALFDAAQAYFGVILATEVVALRQRNVAFLTVQVWGIEKRFAVGDLTRTDAAQAQTRLAIGRANLAVAEDARDRQSADYRRIVGHDPAGLSKAFPYKGLIPKRLNEAVALGLDNHPLIIENLHLVDAQAFQVRQAEGLLLPTLSAVGSVQHGESFSTPFTGRSWSNTVTIGSRIDIPFFQGGAVSAQIRQAKEILGQRRIEVDLVRDQVRDAVVSAWADLQSAGRAIDSANRGIAAAEQALSGVQKEVQVGQRSTLDVLDAQQDLLTVREQLVGAERNRFIASFSLLSAMGRLSAEDLHLPTAVYDPRDHYEAVRNRLFDSSTPDGR